MEELVSRLATHVNIDVSHNRFSQGHHGMSSCHGTSWYELMAMTAVMAVNAWEPRYGKRWIDQDSKINCEIRQGQRHAIADAAVQYGCNISPLVLFQDCHGFSKLCLTGTCKSLDGQCAADSRNKNAKLEARLIAVHGWMPWLFDAIWKPFAKRCLPNWVEESSLVILIILCWYFMIFFPPQFPL